MDDGNEELVLKFPATLLAIGDILLMGEVSGGTQLGCTANGDVCAKYGVIGVIGVKGVDGVDEQEVVLDSVGNFQFVEVVNPVDGFVSYFSLKFTSLSQSSSKMLFLANTVLPMSEVPENCGMVCLILSMSESLLLPLPELVS